jgi:phosphopantothenoylcysteine decarboxylase / phosphopantothenate---cysteine ligase
MLKGKKILLGITGSIAAYKSILLVRLLIKSGAEVKLILTPSAKDFVSPLTLSTLSKNKVLIDMFEEDCWANHVMLGRWADVMVIAPLSCNSLAKMANGFCDNLLQAVYLSATCPVFVAPAMDEDMWKHPSTKDNIKRISSFGNKIIPVESGELASGLEGEGRMAEPETILKHLEDFFFESRTLAGKHALVTAGPTYEAIDPVRFIGNHSSGKMGVAIAEELASHGASVTLVLGPSSLSVNHGIKTIRVSSAEEMYDSCKPLMGKSDIMVMAAAVADYRPESIAEDKIKKKDEDLNLHLIKTKDILKEAGKEKKKDQILVGFALESEDEKKNALKKLKEKNADMIVLNSIRDEGAGFSKDTNKVTIFDRHSNEFNFEMKNKKEVAKDIVNTIIKYGNA